MLLITQIFHCQQSFPFFRREHHAARSKSCSISDSVVMELDEDQHEGGNENGDEGGVLANKIVSGRATGKCLALVLRPRGGVTMMLLKTWFGGDGGVLGMRPGSRMLLAEVWPDEADTVRASRRPDFETDRSRSGASSGVWLGAARCAWAGADAEDGRGCGRGRGAGAWAWTWAEAG